MGKKRIFVGRNAEIEILENQARSKSPSLIVVRGRRRIGKSRLIEEFGQHFDKAYFFTGLPPTDRTTTQSQRDEFLIQMARQGLATDKKEDWSELFFSLAAQCKRSKRLIVLDEVTWMGSKDPNFLGKLKIAWDLYFNKNPNLLLILSGSNSGWIEKNILNSTGFFGRISARIHLKELSLKECNEFWQTQKNRISAYEKFKVLSITGGVPRYLEAIQPRLTAEENIRTLCFRQDGLLFHEFSHIFSDLFFKRKEHFISLVRVLADGDKTLKEFEKHLKREKGGDLTRDLSDLVESGFISRDYTWSFKNGKYGKISRYRLSDNYLRFYLKFIEPNYQSILQQGKIPLPKNWESILGLQFENLVLNNLASIIQILKIPQDELLTAGRYYQTKTTTRKGCQIDLLIQTRHNTLFLCEIKFKKREIGMEICEEVEEKRRRLQIPKGFSVRNVLIHVNGTCDSVLLSDFFSNVIDFSELLKKI